MIKVESKVNIIDNSGGVIAQCIRILKKKTTATIGDKIIVTVKKIKPHKKIEKGKIYTALIVQTKKAFLRKTGGHIRFTQNAVVLLTAEDNLIGSRILGPTLIELRKKKYLKVLSVATGIL